MEVAAWHASWGVNIWMPKGKSISPGKMLGKPQSSEDLEAQFVKFAQGQKDNVVLKDKQGNEVKKKAFSSKDFKSAEEMKRALGLESQE